MEEVTYSNIILNKFVFNKLNLNKEIQNILWSLDFKDYGTLPGEVRFKIKNVEDSIRFKLIEELNKLNLDNYIRDSLNEFSFDINKMTQGEWIPLHNEVTQKSPFEVILWLTKDIYFEGRDFLIKGIGYEKLIKPENGLVCFLDTTCPHTYHGVTKLKTDTSVISITGGLGRK